MNKENDSKVVSLNKSKPKIKEKSTNRKAKRASTSKHNKIKKQMDIEMKKKKILIILTPIVVIASIIFMVKTINDHNNSNTGETLKIDGIDVIKNNDILKDITVDNLVVTNQVMYNSNQTSNYSAIITNTSNSDIDFASIYVVFNIKGEEKKILVLDDSTIGALDNLPIKVSFDNNASDVTNIRYEVNKK